MLHDVATPTRALPPLRLRHAMLFSPVPYWTCLLLIHHIFPFGATSARDTPTTFPLCCYGWSRLFAAARIWHAPLLPPLYPSHGLAPPYAGSSFHGTCATLPTLPSVHRHCLPQFPLPVRPAFAFLHQHVTDGWLFSFLRPHSLPARATLHLAPYST